MLTGPDSLNKYSQCATENTADGGACVGTAQHIAKTGRVSCKSESCRGRRLI